jgi:alcohol dehydrogenase (cytochrome c)
MNPDTGEIVGNFQYHFNDSWDWAAMNAPALLEYEHDGEKVRGLVSPQRNGYLYWLSRETDGTINFVDAMPYVKQNVFTSIDPVTGRPTYNMEHVPGTGKRGEYCPSLWGGKDWPYEAYNPNTGMMYIPSNDNHCMAIEGKVMEYIPGQWWTGVDIPDIEFWVDEEADHYGEIQARNINTGDVVWMEKFPNSMNWGSVLTTAGNLIFLGGTNDRYFRAYNATTGEKLWEIRTNSGIISPPVSYSVDGKQYIAVVSGWGVDARVQNDWIAEQLEWSPEHADVPKGGEVWVFALD